jgi:hypothetical protein
MYERDILYSDKYLHDIPHKPADTSTDEAISITFRETADIMKRIREAGVFFSLDQPGRDAPPTLPQNGAERTPLGQEGAWSIGAGGSIQRMDELIFVVEMESRERGLP